MAANYVKLGIDSFLHRTLNFAINSAFTEFKYDQNNHNYIILGALFDEGEPSYIPIILLPKLYQSLKINSDNLYIAQTFSVNTTIRSIDSIRIFLREDILENDDYHERGVFYTYKYKNNEYIIGNGSIFRKSDNQLLFQLKVKVSNNNSTDRYKISIHNILYCLNKSLLIEKDPLINRVLSNIKNLESFLISRFSDIFFDADNYSNTVPAELVYTDLNPLNLNKFQFSTIKICDTENLQLVL